MRFTPILKFIRRIDNIAGGQSPFGDSPVSVPQALAVGGLVAPYEPAMVEIEFNHWLHDGEEGR